DSTMWSSSPDYPDNDNPPGTNYNASITADGTPYTIDLLNSVSLGTVTMSPPSATLAVSAAGTLTLTTRLSIAGQVNLSGGAIKITNFSTGFAGVHGDGAVQPHTAAF